MTLRTILVFGLLAALLPGCIHAPVYRDANYQTPKDPPRLPARKPVPPADFAAWVSPSGTLALPQTTASTGAVPLPGGAPSGAAPSGAVVAVESLPPLAGTSSAPAQKVQAGTPALQPASLQVAANPQVASPAERPADGGRYVVAKGDSLYGIARRHGLPIRAIIDANALQPPYKLDLGQSLTIPQARVHVVAQGDTVFNIARRYEIDRSELVRLNGIEPPYSIPLGQKLILPQPGTGATATQMAAVPAPKATEKAVVPQPGLVDRTAQRIAKPVPKPKAETAAAKPVVARRGPVGDPPPRAKSTFLWPVQGPVLSSFGGKKSGVHNDGINIAAPRGTPVRAAENGVVAYAGEELKGFGKLLLIKHADGWVTAYAHNEKLLVQQGDVVKRGQSVARVGSSGSVPRPQLHFEVRRGTRAVNPVTMLGPRQTAAAQPS